MREALWQLNTNSYSFVLLDHKTVEAEMLMEAVKYREYGVFSFLISTIDITHRLTRAMLLEQGAMLA